MKGMVSGLSCSFALLLAGSASHEAEPQRAGDSIDFWDSKSRREDMATVLFCDWRGRLESKGHFRPWSGHTIQKKRSCDNKGGCCIFAAR
jgi:hypothetical protein